VIFNNLEEEIVNKTTSAMFGLPGKEELRMGHPIGKPRTLGIGWLLYAFTRVMLPETVVEIGCGGSSACVLWGLKHNEKGVLHTCDTWPSGNRDDLHYGENCEKNEKGEPLMHYHAEVIRFLRKWDMLDICKINHMSSKEFVPKWKDPIDMIVVDGDHSLSFLENDIQLLKYLRPGGYALFHDFLPSFYVIGKTITDWVESSDEWSLIVEPSHLSLAIIQRKYTMDEERVYMAWVLSQAENENNYKTPFQFTDPRAFCLKPWQGYIFQPSEENHLCKPAGVAMAEKILAREKETGIIVQDLKEIEDD